MERRRSWRISEDEDCLSSDSVDTEYPKDTGHSSGLNLDSMDANYSIPCTLDSVYTSLGSVSNKKSYNGISKVNKHLGDKPNDNLSDSNLEIDDHMVSESNCSDLFRTRNSNNIPGTDRSLIEDLNNNQTQNQVNSINGNYDKVTIIIEPISFIDREERLENETINIKSFFANDFALAKNLEKSILNKYVIANTTKNIRKGFLVVNLEKVKQGDLGNILELTQLGNWKIKCRLPRVQQSCRGVIGPIGIDTPDIEISNELSKYFKQNVAVQRITRGKEKNPTLSVKLTFEMDTLPEYVILFHQKFRTRVFVSRPWQCYQCQGFGHNAADCRGKPRCVICSGYHKLSECPEKTVEEKQRKLKCINCQGDHTANYSRCPKIKMANEIEKIRAYRKILYRDAVATVKSQGNRPMQTNSQILQTFDSQRSVEANTQSHPVQKHSIGIKSKSVQTQTEPLQQNENQENDLVNKIMSQMAILIVKLLNVKKPGNKQQMLDTVKEVTGIEIEPSLILDEREKELKQNKNNKNNPEKTVVSDLLNMQKRLRSSDGNLHSAKNKKKK